MPNQLSKEAASQIAVEFLKQQKNTDKIEIAMIEEHTDGWMVRGTCPIDMEGHPWAEKFAVVVDWKGKIKDTNYALL
ncbi:hypothetical protein G4O51_09135 [Candidatus Bathyarchaeota archaeon A05DMB-2]|jgi:hypothetical protein|nr:hypothetical protein [Candidatus Bathyarchaeota archaeon A05DMB-2]